MKNILYCLTLIAFILFSCEKEEVKAVLNASVSAPSMINPVSGTTAINENDTLEKITFKWNRADYGSNVIVNYLLQIDSAGRGFSKAVTIGSTTADSITLTLGELNKLLITSLKIPANDTSVLEYKVSASLNSPDTLVDHKDAVSSEVYTITIITWKKIQPPAEPPVTLWVPGAYQNWTPATAPVIYKVGDDLFEGYVYMNIGDAFKFTSSPDWEHINYGSGGDGILTTDGLADGLTVADAGYYKFNVDTKNLTYTAVLIESFGLIGTATPGAWDNSTPMTFDAGTGKWSVTFDLVPGALKFRANNNWDINYGPADINALQGVLISTNDAVNITTAGTYNIVLDFSRSSEAHNYTYLVTTEAIVEDPATLWVPGAYQSWTPATAPVIYKNGDGTYEGYVYMSIGDQFKFTSSSDWDHINYGSGGDGILTTDGLAGGITVADAGYYKFNVDIRNLTYTAVLINTWGMIGTSTPGAWDNSTAMTFDEVAGTWSATLNLVPGALKFRANDGWDINYGPADINALEGTLISTNDAVDIKETGNYTVTIDFSKSSAGHNYIYAVTKN